MLLFNGQLLPEVALSLPNRGLAFGDGFFETLIFAAGRLRLAPDHLARMTQGRPSENSAHKKRTNPQVRPFDFNESK